MPRVKHKWWRNGKGGAWTARIIWYAEGEPSRETGWDLPDNIRLSLEDSERRINYFPQSLEEAHYVWHLFKEGAVLNGPVPFLSDLLKVVGRKYPVEGRRIDEPDRDTLHPEGL